MRPLFEELAHHDTLMGVLTLRRRTLPGDGRDVFEVKLGDEFLMSSLFTVAEEELARLGLGAHDGSQGLSVVVGGLGLGWTAFTALDDPRVTSMTVVDALPEVIGWHHDGLLPGADDLMGDPRTTLAHGDVFSWSAGQDIVDVPATVDVFLLDVDHSPRHVLAPSHAAFYTIEGLQRMASRLRPGGVFALWSDDPPDDEFLDRLGQIMDDARAEVVTFRNFLIDGESSNTVYLAHRRD